MKRLFYIPQKLSCIANLDLLFSTTSFALRHYGSIDLQVSFVGSLALVFVSFFG